jgi:hypothetical protein
MTLRTRIRRAALRALALAGAALCLAGCEKRVVTSDYFPLRDGNRWEYRLLDRPRLKALAEGRTVETEPDVSGQPALPEPPGEPKAEVVAEPGEAPAEPVAPARRVALALKESIDDVTFRAAYDGLEQVWSKRGGYVGFQNAQGRHYLLILPAHTGYRWIVTDAAGEDLYFEIEAHAPVATPAGSFKECVISRQETRDRREMFRYWFAPNVGLVRRSKFFLGEEVFRQELVAYSVNPARTESRAAEEREIQTALKGARRGQEHRRKQ